MGDTYKQAGQLNSLKVIFSLREPISRDLSWYNHLKSGDLDFLAPKNPVLAPKHPVVFVKNHTYDEYARTFILPRLQNGTSHSSSVEISLYAKHLETWFQLFRRNQILVLSYDEVVRNSTKARERVELFLGQRFPAKRLEKTNPNDFEGKVVLPTCSVQQEWNKFFQPHNERLYALLSRGGAEMEQDPFPKFRLGNCTN